MLIALEFACAAACDATALRADQCRRQALRVPRVDSCNASLSGRPLLLKPGPQSGDAASSPRGRSGIHV